MKRRNPLRCTEATINAFGVYGRCPRDGGGVTGALEDAGYRWRPFGMGVDIETMHEEFSWSGKTVGAFMRAHPTGWYYLVSAGHAMALVDGVLTDTMGGSRRQRLQVIIEVIPPDSARRGARVQLEPVWWDAPRRNPQAMPEPHPQGWNRYYKIDPADPPTIPAVRDAWMQGVRPTDSMHHADHPLKHVLRYARPGNFLRAWTDPEAFTALVEDIRKHGVREPVMVNVSREGTVQIGEGNHRLAALLLIYPAYQRDQVLVPVRFIMRQSRLVNTLGGTLPTWATFMDQMRFWQEDDPRRWLRDSRTGHRGRGAPRHKPFPQPPPAKSRNNPSRVLAAMRESRRLDSAGMTPVVPAPVENPRQRRRRT